MAGPAAVAGPALLPPLTGSPTASEIVARNAAARGGAAAWHRIDTMVWVGHMESADPSVPRLSFVLEQKRPNKTRFELANLAQRSVRVFDGTRGWKVRPNHDGSLDVQPYNAQEVQFARQSPVIDGPLVDFLDKGILVDFVGTESLEGRKAYRLHVRLPAGETQEVWIDAETFLELQYDRISYTPDGKPRVISVAYRNYQSVEGLQVPGMLDIGVGSNHVPDRMVIEKIALNPPLDDKAFERPAGARRHRMATVVIPAPARDPRQAFGADSMPPPALSLPPAQARDPAALQP